MEGWGGTSYSFLSAVSKEGVAAERKLEHYTASVSQIHSCRLTASEIWGNTSIKKVFQPSLS